MKIDHEMRRRGYDMGLTGSRYLKGAVQMVAARSEMERTYMTKELYPTIAKAAHVDWRCVERAMRYAVRGARPGRTVRQELYDIAAVVRAHED